MNYDINIQQGADFYTTLSLTDCSGNAMNLSNCILSGYIKTHFYDTGILASLNPTIINVTGGIISLSISASFTTGIPVNYSFYDISLYNSGSNLTSKILYGKAICFPQVTF